MQKRGGDVDKQLTACKASFPVGASHMMNQDEHQQISKNSQHSHNIKTSVMPELNCSYIGKTSDNHQKKNQVIIIEVNTFLALEMPLMRESPSGCEDSWRMILKKKKIIFLGWHSQNP